MTKILDLYPNSDGGPKLRVRSWKITDAVNPQLTATGLLWGWTRPWSNSKQGGKYTVNTLQISQWRSPGYIINQHRMGKTTGKEIEEHFRGLAMAGTGMFLKSFLLRFREAASKSHTRAGGSVLYGSDLQATVTIIQHSRSASSRPKNWWFQNTSDAARNMRTSPGRSGCGRGAIPRHSNRLSQRTKNNWSDTWTLNAYNLTRPGFHSQYGIVSEGCSICAPDDCVKLLASEGRNSRIRWTGKETWARWMTVHLKHSKGKDRYSEKFPILKLRSRLRKLRKDKIISNSTQCMNFYDRMADIARVNANFKNIFWCIWDKHKDVTD